MVGKYFNNTSLKYINLDEVIAKGALLSDI